MLSKFQTRLSAQELEALKELVDLMRQKVPFWAA